MTRFNGGFTGFVLHAYTHIYKHIDTLSNLIPSRFALSENQIEMFFRCIFVLLLASLSLLFLSIHKKLANRQRRKTEQREQQQQQQKTDPARGAEPPGEVGPGGSTRSLLLPEEEESGDGETGSGLGRVDPGGKRKKRRARAKKKKKKKGSEEEDNGDGGEEEEGFSGGREREDFLLSYPFTSSSSGTQRKIKLHYDEIMKHHRSKELTFTQVAHFAHCLVEAKNELQHKADVIQRKFTIKKALLLKADRSSFDRLRQQIYKLELEQKRLEEDAFVYNWLQQQLKLSPAYKKMLEIGACMESEANSGELRESEDTEYSDISFEELLAQEKKDSFWQRNGKLRPCSG